MEAVGIIAHWLRRAGTHAVFLLLLLSALAVLRHTAVVVGAAIVSGPPFFFVAPVTTVSRSSFAGKGFSPSSLGRIRALPSRVLGAYAPLEGGDECAERVTRAVVDGANVIFWYFISMHVNATTGEPQFSTSTAGGTQG